MKNQFSPEHYLLNLFRAAGYQLTPEPKISREEAVHQERVKIANEIRKQLESFIAEPQSIVAPVSVEQQSDDASIFIDGTFDDIEWVERQRILFESQSVQRLLVLFRAAGASSKSTPTISDAF